MADLDDLDPKDLPGFPDDDSMGQRGADPAPDSDKAGPSPDEPGVPGFHPHLDDDDASLGRD